MSRDQAEGLRNIVKAQEVNINASARLITVTSGKGGAGKSSTAVNLAVQFQKLGYRVIIFDADFGLANIEVMFGIIPQYNLSDLIFGGKSLENILVDGPNGIKFISGGSGISELSNMSKENVRYLVSKLIQLEGMADIIVVDTGAGISDAVLEFVKASGEVLLVTTPEPTSITDAYALLKTLKRSEGYIKDRVSIKLIANRVRDKKDAQDLYAKLKSVSEKFLEIKLDFLGYVPDDPNMMRSVMQQKPVSISYERAKSSIAYEKLGKKLLAYEEKELPQRTGIGQVFMNIFRARTGK